MTSRRKYRRKQELLGPARAQAGDGSDQADALPPFEGQTPQEVEDFKARGVAGVVLTEEGERVEVPKGKDTAEAVRSALATARKRSPRKTSEQEGSS